MKKIPVIGQEARFYGYIIGVSIGPAQAEGSGRGMFATFEYNEGTKIYEVPDIVLFRKLMNHLVSMQLARKAGDSYGIDKLWIEKVGRKWVVSLP